MKSKGKKSFINHSIVQMMCRLEGLVSGCDAANLLLESSAGAPKRLRLFPEQPEGGQTAAVRKGCERGNFLRIFVGVNFNFLL